MSSCNIPTINLYPKHKHSDILSCLEWGLLFGLSYFTCGGCLFFLHLYLQHQIRQAERDVKTTTTQSVADHGSQCIELAQQPRAIQKKIENMIRCLSYMTMHLGRDVVIKELVFQFNHWIVKGEGLVIEDITQWATDLEQHHCITKVKLSRLGYQRQVKLAKQSTKSIPFELVLFVDE